VDRLKNLPKLKINKEASAFQNSVEQMNVKIFIIPRELVAIKEVSVEMFNAIL
jgi:hypothetical protein